MKFFKSKKKAGGYSAVPESEEAAAATETREAAAEEAALVAAEEGEAPAVDIEANESSEEEALLPPSSQPAADDRRSFLGFLPRLRGEQFRNFGRSWFTGWQISTKRIILVAMVPLAAISLVVVSLLVGFTPPADGAATWRPANDGKLHPPVIPLIVRNPYFSAWLGHAREAPWSHWPIFWTGQEIGLGVMMHVKKHNAVYPLLGKPHSSLDPQDDEYQVRYPVYNGPTYDASTTNLSYTILPDKDSEDEKVQVVLSFVSPLTVNDTMRQSLPAGYMKVYITGTLESSVYVDINGHWVTGPSHTEVSWSYQESESLKYWSMKRTHEALFTEWNDRAEWGTLFFATDKSASHQSGESSKMRSKFARYGYLNNAVERKSRAAMDREPVLAFARSFGADAEEEFSEEALFSLGHVQSPVVQFESARGLTHMRPLWSSYFNSVNDMMHFHFDDFHTVTEIAAPLSEEILSHSSRAMSTEEASTYRGILYLSARQILGATQFSGTPNKPIIFLKEISSNGNFQTVDVIFPAFPFFLWANPKWLRYLLEPLLEHQAAGLYPNDYSMHDMGSHFPNATGHPDGRDEYMPVEECGNMLIMAASVVGSIIDEYGGGEAGRSKAKEWIEGKWGENGSERSRYHLWKKWTKYLIDFSLKPENQLCTDDFAGRLANQTNLALKGIIGIKAMAQIAGVLDEASDEEYYESVANNYIKEWETFAVSDNGKHTKLAYHWRGSWGTLYNLYADALLCLRSDTPDNSLAAFSTLPKTAGEKQSFVPKRIYKMQSDWYPQVEQKYGLPLDSRHLYTKSDWEFFAAAVSGRKTREMIVHDVGKWVSETSTDLPFTDLYDTEGSGGWPGIHFKARPVVGGHFAVLALEKSCNGEGLAGFGYGDNGEDDISLDVEDAKPRLTGTKETQTTVDDDFEGLELVNIGEKQEQQRIFDSAEDGDPEEL